MICQPCWVGSLFLASLKADTGHYFIIMRTANWVNQGDQPMTGRYGRDQFTLQQQMVINPTAAVRICQLTIQPWPAGHGWRHRSRGHRRGLGDNNNNNQVQLSWLFLRRRTSLEQFTSCSLTNQQITNIEDGSKASSVYCLTPIKTLNPLTAVGQ